jgi:hypothetical protein
MEFTKKGRNEMKQWSIVLLVVLASVGSLFGQRTSASISGVVTDPSGAVVPNAQVTATSTDTGAVSSANANANGFYVIPNLQPGPYQLDVAVTGFESFEEKGIVLQVGAQVSVNVSLKLGATTAKVTVTGAAPLVDTRDQTVSFAVTPQFTEQMPLNGRNILQLMALAPDTSAHGGTAAASQLATRPDASAGFVTSSGEARENSTAFYLDGGLNMDTFTQVSNVYPNPDAVQEFTFDTNAYNAKYGGLGGGVLNAATRGGTNQVHGSAFEYVRNGDLNARNFFAATHDTMNRNQFGFSLGAPIQKDKTFAFFSFQRTTFRYATTANVAYGPTAAELAGDWSVGAVGAQLYNNVLTRDPTTGLPLTFTTVHSPATAFPGNQIPVSLYVPIALKILAQVPRGDPITGKITYSSPTLNNDMQYVARVDRNFGDKLRISGSLLRDTYETPIIDDPKNALTAANGTKDPSIHASLNTTYSFGPNLVTTVGVGLSRVLARDLGSHEYPTVQQLGGNWYDWNGSPSKGETGGWFGWFGWGVNDHYFVSRDQLGFTNNWTYLRGNHTLDFGAEVTLNQSILNQDYLGSGWTGSFCTLSGNDAVDFLMGQNCYFQQYGLLYNAPRGKEPAIYINDTWRVKHGFTLNLGLRWEPWVPWPDMSAAKVGMVVDQAAFAAGTVSTRYPNLPPGYLVHGDPGVPDGLAHSDWKLFDPRVGLAWDVRGDGKTSIRVGAGIYHDQPFGRMYNQMMTTAPFVSSTVITDNSVPWQDPYNAAPYNGVLVQVQSPPPSNSTYPMPFSFAIGFAPDFKPPATAQWNLTIEHQLGQGFLLRAGYEASQSWHMFDGIDVNPQVYIPGTNPDGTPKSTPGNISERRPWYPYYGGSVIKDESTATDNYQAMVISVEKRMTGNLSLLSGYRWGKCLNETSLAVFATSEYSNPRNKMLDYGLCNSDIGSQFKTAAVYRLPSLHSWGFAGRNILGGWTMSGIWNWRDGFPYSVTGGGAGYVNDGGDFSNRADLVGDPNLPGGRSRAAKVAEYFNTAAFVSRAVGMDGTTARNFMRGPGYFNLDYSLIKSFPIPYGPRKETQKIDFRAEAFNIFNNTNFNAPNASRSSLQFGQLQSALDPRIIQFALKFIF